MTRCALAKALMIGESTVDDMVRRGVLPRPVKVDGVDYWIWQEVDERLHYLPPQGIIYVAGFATYAKIGFTGGDKVEHRIASIQCGCPEKIEVYATIPGSMKDEAALHRRFSRHRSYGEWFRREGTFAEWIDAGCPL